MSSSLKSITQQLDGYDLSSDHHEIVYDLVCSAYELGKKDSLNGFYKFPIPSPDNDFDDFDERYKLLEGRTVRFVHPDYGYLETILLFNTNEYGLKYSSILSWIDEGVDEALWCAANGSNRQESGWTAYVSVDLSSFPKTQKTLASALTPGTFFIGRIKDEELYFMVMEGYLGMVCIPVGVDEEFSPEVVEVVKIIAKDLDK